MKRSSDRPKATAARARAGSKPAPAEPRDGVVDQLRRAIRDDGRTDYALAAEAGIHRAQLGRFRDGGDLKGESIGRLCRTLRLELRPFGRSARSGRAA